MRELKFRGLYEERESGKRVWTYYGVGSKPCLCGAFWVVEDLQFIGLYDDDGKEMWEGDIIEQVNSLYPRGFMEYAERHVISWNNEKAGFNLFMYKKSESGGGYITRVIGNIHENPELLSGIDRGMNRGGSK